jgi:hypothetical protein
MLVSTAMMQTKALTCASTFSGHQVVAVAITVTVVPASGSALRRQISTTAAAAESTRADSCYQTTQDWRGYRADATLEYNSSTRCLLHRDFTDQKSIVRGNRATVWFSRLSTGTYSVVKCNIGNLVIISTGPHVTH